MKDTDAEVKAIHTYSHILLFNELCLPAFPSSFPIPYPLNASFLLCQPTKALCLSLSIFLSHKYSQSRALWLIVFSRLVLPPLEQSSFDINIYVQKYALPNFGCPLASSLPGGTFRAWLTQDLKVTCRSTTGKLGGLLS